MGVDENIISGDHSGVRVLKAHTLMYIHKATHAPASRTSQGLSHTHTHTSTGSCSDVEPTHTRTHTHTHTLPTVLFPDIRVLQKLQSTPLRLADTHAHRCTHAKKEKKMIKVLKIND